MKKMLLRRLAYSLCLGLVLISCSKETETVSPVESTEASTERPNQASLRSSSENLAMGNPSGASTSTSTYWNYLITKTQYAMSYHRDRGTPNWISWHLNSTWFGNASRQNDFRPDNALPSGWYRVASGDYSGSGFDRGHNCPSGDRTYSTTDNSATFLMTNMIPQASNNNQKTWNNLENYCRKLANEGNELYIIMGSYGSGGTGNNGYKTTIAGGKVTVPRRIWKATLVLPNGSDDVSRVTASTRVIAVDTPNDNSISSSWASYRTSVDAIEEATGYNLFSNVPSSIQSVIEDQVDDGPTE